jgi:hypothetical protein
MWFWHLSTKLVFSEMHIFRGRKLYHRIQNLFIKSYVSFKCVVINHQKGEIESAFIPFVSFSDLDNNTFKGLTSLLSVEQEFQYDEHT